jgi:peptide deformylase
MSILDIILVPDPILKQVAHKVETLDATIQTQIDNMIETMYAARGVGLAANQVGIANRIFTMDVDYRAEENDERNPIVMINPEIIEASDELSEWEEGCLSIPSQYAIVTRPALIKVKYMDRKGEAQIYTGEALGSHCVQHELDHLNGVLFIDHLSRMKRNMILKKIEKSRAL